MCERQGAGHGDSAAAVKQRRFSFEIRVTISEGVRGTIEGSESGVSVIQGSGVQKCEAFVKVIGSGVQKG